MTGIAFAGDDDGTEPQSTCIMCIIATTNVEVFEAGCGAWAERADAAAATGGITTTDDATASSATEAMAAGEGRKGTGARALGQFDLLVVSAR